MKNVRFRLALPLAAGAVALVLPLLALPMVLVAFFSWLNLPSQDPSGKHSPEAMRRHRLLQRAHLVGILVVLVGVGRFITNHAIPGIVKKGQHASEEAAVSQLREILFAERAAQRYAHADPENDGIGSFRLVQQLAGLAGGQPVLDQRYQRMVRTEMGPATELGHYLYAVCLPRIGGGFTAVESDGIDLERAEREFIAYAWPSSRAPGMKRGFSLDQHETILEIAPDAAGIPVFLGPSRPPQCEEVLAHRDRWTLWRDKQPRGVASGHTE